MYTLGAGRKLIKRNIFVCLLNLMAWKASWAHRTGENEKKINDKIIKSVQTSSAFGIKFALLETADFKEGNCHFRQLFSMRDISKHEKQ